MNTTAKQKGTKPPLIFIHGLRGSSLGLAEIASHFPDYKVFSPDLPPFGKSRPLNSYTADTYAKFIADFITAHQLDRPILIGHSMGSIITAATATKYPHLINQKLIFLSPISTKPSKFFATLQPLSVILPSHLVDYISTRFLFIPRDKKLFKDALQLTHQCAKTYLPRRHIYKSVNFSAKNCISDFAFKNESILIAGEHDRLIPQHKTSSLAKKRGFKTIFIPDSGHLINYEVPAEVATAIRDFIEH